MNATVKVSASKNVVPPMSDLVEPLMEGIDEIATSIEDGPMDQEIQDEEKPPVVVVVQGLSEGFVEVNSSKLIWSPKVAFNRSVPENSVRGYLLEKVILGFDGGNPFHAYLIQLTKDCPCVDRHGEVVQAKVSQEVFIKEHYEFQPWDGWCNNADQVIQVEAIPLGLRDYEDGHQSWMFKWGVGLAASRLTVSPKSMARFAKKS